jgi:DNA-binding transcriptional LysR family regulator
MDLKAIKTFHLIAKYESFIRAAEELNYSPSAVTMQIRKLETDLGVMLIERGKPFRLTEAGRLFREQSLPLIRHMEQLQAIMSDWDKGEAGHVRLGVTEPAASRRLPGLLKIFLERHPNIRISVDVADTPTLVDRVLRGDADLALCTSPDAGEELYYEALFREPFAVLLPEHHPLVRKSAVDARDFREHRLLVTGAACPYRRKLEMTLQDAGNVPTDVMEIGSMPALKHYVACGLGIALVPEILLEPLPVGTVVRPLGEGLTLDMTFGLLYPKTGSPFSRAADRLYRFLRENLPISFPRRP